MALVLLVEDDTPLLRLYQGALESEHTVIAVETCRHAIDAINTHRPDVVVLDLNLPDAPGTQILDHLAAHSVLSNTIAVVMTAFPQYKSDDFAFPAQMLSKPVTTSMIMRAVANALAEAPR